MPTLHDLSKEQLIELLDLSIKELSPKDAEFEIRLEKTKLANAESPFELYKCFKDSLRADINIYTI